MQTRGYLNPFNLLTQSLIYSVGNNKMLRQQNLPYLTLVLHVETNLNTENFQLCFSPSRNVEDVGDIFPTLPLKFKFSAQEACVNILCIDIGSYSCFNYCSPSMGMQGFTIRIVTFFFRRYLAKRILRKYNGISRKNFHLFLKECEFRFNYGSLKRQFLIFPSLQNNSNEPSE